MSGGTVLTIPTWMSGIGVKGMEDVIATVLWLLGATRRMRTSAHASGSPRTTAWATTAGSLWPSMGIWRDTPLRRSWPLSIRTILSATWHGRHEARAPEGNDGVGLSSGVLPATRAGYAMDWASSLPLFLETVAPEGRETVHAPSIAART